VHNLLAPLSCLATDHVYRDLLTRFKLLLDWQGDLILDTIDACLVAAVS